MPEKQFKTPPRWEELAKALEATNKLTDELEQAAADTPMSPCPICCRRPELVGRKLIICQSFYDALRHNPRVEIVDSKTPFGRLYDVDIDVAICSPKYALGIPARFLLDEANTNYSSAALDAQLWRNRNA